MIRSVNIHTNKTTTTNRFLFNVRVFSWLALMMSFNNLLLGGINFSLVFFVAFVFLTARRYNFLNLNELPQIFALFFAIGAVISVIDTNGNGDESLERALIVLPNFMYWSLMIIIFVNVLLPAGLISKYSLESLSKFIAIGVLLSLIFYEFKNVLNFPFIKYNTPNSYAFTLVCYSAIGVTYIRQKYGKTRMLIYVAIILLSMLFLERRAGFVLVFSSVFMALNFNNISLKTLYSFGFSILFVFIILQLSIVENFLYDASPRIHESIYESENIATQDQSYLTRLAMVEKGIIIFSENPLTGIGLSNFPTHYVAIPGNFEGSELVIRKDLSNKSGHNSYIALLAEGGLFIIVPFLLLIAFNLYHFVIDFKKRTNLESAFYWSFLAMVIHIYLISEIFNVFAWFLIAIVTTISVKYKRLDNIKYKV